MVVCRHTINNQSSSVPNKKLNSIKEVQGTPPATAVSVAVTGSKRQIIKFHLWGVHEEIVLIIILRSEALQGSF